MFANTILSSQNGNKKKMIIFVVVVAKRDFSTLFEVESQEERSINRVDIEAPALS